MSELDELRARLDRLEADNAALRRELDGLRARPRRAGASAAPASLDAARSRREMFRLAGAAAAGAVGAGVVFAAPAAADVGVTFTGAPNTTADPLRSTYTATGAGVSGFLFESGSAGSASNGNTNAGALAGSALASGGPTNGVLGISAKANGYGVFGHGTNAVGGGVFGEGVAVGVYGSSNSGVGLIGQGARAALQLTSFGATAPAPPARTDAHVAGEIDIDGAGVIWVCIESGSPGRWRRLADRTAAGAFHAITPARAFDSRVAAYGSIAGPFAPNTNRAIPIMSDHNAAGAVVTADVVPAGATAIAYNLTVTGTTGPNFLSVAAGDVATAPNASAINWSAANQSIANALVVPVSPTRTIRVFAGDQSGSTHVLIDVLGYYA